MLVAYVGVVNMEDISTMEHMLLLDSLWSTLSVYFDCIPRQLKNKQKTTATKTTLIKQHHIHKKKFEITIFRDNGRNATEVTRQTHGITP